MEREGLLVKIFDYGAIVLSFFVFMLTWFNGNLTAMPWYGLLLVIVFATMAALGVFAMLRVRAHRRGAIAFGVLLLLMSVPSMLHRSFGSLSVAEMTAFYLKQVYVPLLAGTSLFLLLKNQDKTWQILLRWGTRLYAVLGTMLGTMLLYQNTFSPSVSLESAPEEVQTMLAVSMFVGIVLAVAGLMIAPLYIVWRNTTQDVR
ncbi:MAG: hypothetical protein OXB96_00850 [Candidatus Kaiserbacteria bacterium]|nr:hypothetical protein [Candidatus Kaiserbacteria bacterium]